MPEWLQQGVLFEEEERDEWLGVYKLAGRPWPTKYDIPGACCMPDGAGAAAAQPGPAGQPSKPDHKPASRLARSNSDMDIDEPALPELPRTSLHAAPESMLAVAQAAASGQSCGEWRCSQFASDLLSMHVHVCVHLCHHIGCRAFASTVIVSGHCFCHQSCSVFRLELNASTACYPNTAL